MAAIPLLITMDLEIAGDHNLGDQRVILYTLSKEFKALGLPMTIFVTAAAAEQFGAEMEMLQQDGHEIACHGLTHSREEDYKRMTPENIRASIAEATRRLELALNDRPLCFRGPAMTTSRETHRALIEHGYIADFSVCSQRIPFPPTKGGELQWLTAPRKPYQPSSRSPFRAGTMPLLVVPLSCLGAPFLSGLLYLAGLRGMKLFFRVLLQESLLRQKPVVYAFHSYEFARPSARPSSQPLVQRLYIQDRRRRYDLHHAFMLYLSGFDCLAPTTAARYVRRFYQSC